MVDGFVFQDAFLDEHDHIAQVDTTRTDQLAFATKHAFLDFRFKFQGFTTTQQQIHAAYIETDQVGSAASSSTTPTGKTGLERGLHFKDLVQQSPVELVIVDGALFDNRVAKVFHFMQSSKFQVQSFKFKVSSSRFQVSRLPQISAVTGFEIPKGFNVSHPQ